VSAAAPPGPAAAPVETFVVDLPAFSGPLDLLLALIRDERLDVYDIPIARVAEQFLARVHALALDEAADYLDMAARLVRIKAQLLLPRGADDDAWEDPRAELVRRLLEYQQVREVVDHLDRLGEARRGRFSRGAAPQRELAAELPPPAPGRAAVSLAELLAAVDRVLRAAREPVVHDVVARALDVAGAIGHVRALLALRARARWSDVVAGDAEPWQVLSALLALLEMAKLGEVRLAQQHAFGAVQIERGDGDPAGDARPGEEAGAPARAAA
jgi:segregation and condensation protein A